MYAGVSTMGRLHVRGKQTLTRDNRSTRNMKDKKRLMGKGNQENTECRAVQKTNKRTKNVLTDKTNSELNTPSTGRSLRQRHNNKPSNDVSTSTDDSSLSSSFDKGVIGCPRITPGKKRNSSVLCPPTTSDSKLANIVKLQEKSRELDSRRKCVYKCVADEVLKPRKTMLPEEKLQLYEFEVDQNEPKRTKTKKIRKRKAPKKKVDLSISSSDCSIGNVLKCLRGLSTESSHSIPTISGGPSSRHANKLQTRLSKHVHFKNRPTNSTPELRNMHVNMKRNHYAALVSSPDSSPIVCGTASLASEDPAMIVENNTSVEECCTTEMDTDIVDVAHTPPQVRDHPPPTPRQQHSTTDTRQNNNSTNILNNSGFLEESSSPDVSKSSVTSVRTSNLSFFDKVTLRRKFLHSMMPRLSSLEPRELSVSSPVPLNISNCFGFDDNGDSDEPNSPPTPVGRRFKKRSPVVSSPAPLRQVVNKKTNNAVCSTPNNKPALSTRPTRLSTPQLKKILAPLVAKRPVVSSKPSRDPVRDSSLLDPVSVSFPSLVSDSCSIEVNPSSSLLFTDTTDQTPITFDDEVLPTHFSKPARRSYDRPARPKRRHSYNNEQDAEEEEEEEVVVKKAKRKPKEYTKTEKKHVADWVANINAQFDEIEDVQLCVE